MILYFDTETTGLYPGNICQLAYVMQSKNGLESRNLFFEVDNVEAGAFAMHGFSVQVLKKLSGGKRFEDFIEIIAEDFGRADVVVAHNAAFDVMFMRAEFERLGKIFKTNKEFCSMKKTVGLCALPKSRGRGYKYPKLFELCEHFGITENDVCEKSQEIFGEKYAFHDARFDAVAVYLAVNAGLYRVNDFAELEEFL